VQTGDHEITAKLKAWNEGNTEAKEQLFELVYDELWKTARTYMARERRKEHTLQPTALVNEAYIRLVESKKIPWENRKQFFGIVARLMRQILVEYARRHNAEKRGGHHTKIQLEEALAASRERQIDLIRLNDALEKLNRLDPDLERLVEIRYFAGQTIEETAVVLGISEATVKRRWKVAKKWLTKELANDA
jgi:RNA polymerase sigma factor (TIGR02999 family)